MKTSTADQWFSKCVRERANWRCEKCGKWFSPHASRGLDCSHFIGRSNWSVRFDPDNAFAHCFGCHSFFEKNPHKFVEWAQEHLGPKRYRALIERSEDVSLAKAAHRSKKEIAAHYKAEYERLQKVHAGAIVAMWHSERALQPVLENWE